ncbi:MAG: serine/threonine protein kinase [bacterium]|nr:serine/threonine protein kinase [bacterium]
MDADNWRRIEELFHQALELPPAERAAFVEASGENDEVRGEVAALLAAETRADEKIDGAIADALTLAVDEPVPEHIGPYRVLEKLGEGGLATVYLAERSDREYRMRVAIKVVKRGMDTAEILRRLRLERQILAGLEHPNVARLLDGGSLEDGRPYVVMEAIDGEPIDRHCDRRRLGLPQRLAIFRKVCSAVHAAHRSLVIHRDLKPSNILVTEDGEPKLLDFGIAKLLDPTRVDQTVARTVTGMHWLTPEYASPEQVRGEPLTTAADVYALGVLLYELLCGRRPFHFETGKPQEVLRLVCESDPPRPSTRLGAAAGGEKSTEEVAVARDETPERLRKRLEGDLDTIVGVAMHREPGRRYPSAQALEDDLRRYLESQPLTARPDTAFYLAGKFIHRNRAAVFAAGLVVASLVVGIIGTTRALLIAEKERLRAEQHLQELEEVVSFNVGMFEIADPGEARGNTVTVREVLDRAAERVPAELGDRPAVAARLLSTLGQVHRALGLYEPAAGLLERALDLRRAAFGEDSIEVARGIHELAGARHDQRRLDESAELYLDAADRRGRLLGEDHAETAASLHGLGTVHLARSEWEMAEEVYRRALDLRRAALGEDHVDTAESLNDLAEVLFYRERYADAEPIFEQALAIRREHLGEDHPAVAETLHNLAATAAQLSRPGDAEERYLEVLALRRKLFAGPHRDLVKTLHNVAVAIGDQQRIEEAEVYLREALAMAEAIQPDDPLHVGRGLRALARNLEGQGRAAEGEALIRRALDLELATLGEVHQSVVMTRYGLARLLDDLGEHGEAIVELEAQIRAQRQLTGLPPERLAYPLTLLAVQHARLGNCDPARGALDEALEAHPSLGESPSLSPRRDEVRATCP